MNTIGNLICLIFSFTKRAVLNYDLKNLIVYSVLYTVKTDTMWHTLIHGIYKKRYSNKVVSAISTFINLVSLKLCICISNQPQTFSFSNWIWMPIKSIFQFIDDSIGKYNECKWNAAQLNHNHLISLPVSMFNISIWNSKK